MTEEMLDAEWRAIDEEKQKTEPPLIEAAEEYFEWERQQVLTALEKKRRAWRLEIDISVGDLLNMVRAAQELIDRLNEPMINAIEQGFESGLLRIDADGPPFDPQAPGVQEVVRHSFRRNNIQAKEWLTTRDGRQREGHGEANGQRKPITEPFDVRADTDKPFEQLEYPGDPTASVENVVNCRCTVLPSFGDEQDADVSPIAGVVETEGPS